MSAGPFNDRGSIDRIQRKLAGLLAGMKEDAEFVGQQIAESIVRTTLAGIGKNDQPFAPYSKYYQDVLDQLGGKPRQVVDLRGIIKKGEARAYRGKRDRGQGRKTTVTGWAGTFELETRPQRGLYDPQSELSLDLIRSEGNDSGFCKVIYEPRDSPHMIRHQEGATNIEAPPWWHHKKMSLPTREWFTIEKSAVKEAAATAARDVLSARLIWFNNHANTGGRPPGAGRRRTPRD